MVHIPFGIVRANGSALDINWAIANEKPGHSGMLYGSFSACACVGFGIL